MTMNIFIVVLALVPITAAAQVRDAGFLLRGSIHALGQAGFAGMQDIPTPQVPSALSAPATVPVDETAQAIIALVEAVQKVGIEGTFSAGVLRKVGIAYIGEVYSFKVIRFTDGDTVRHFTVTAVRGKNDILLESIKKVDGKKQIRSYLISANGSLLGAAVSWKENALILTDSIPLADAEAGYREQLDYWMRYYRANLKKP